MPKIEWDKTGERLYEAGVDRCVMYPRNDDGAYVGGVAWNGLVNVGENPSGAEANPIFADNIKYLNLISAEEFAANLEAYTYPEEFAICDGSAAIAAGVYVGQQTRRTFGLCYRTRIGNDISGTDYGYKLHLVYGCQATPSGKDYGTINDNPEAATMSWEINTTPVNVTGHKATAHLVVDSTKVSAEKLAALEDVLYGSENSEARMPMPDEVVSIVGQAA